MKPIHFLVAILGAFSLVSCQDTKEYLSDPLSEKDVYRSIGEQIPFETGMKWIELYKKQRSRQGRLDLDTVYTVSAPQIETMLKSGTNLVGVAFHYAIDDFGEGHIVLIPIDESMSLWSTIPGRVFLDANTGDEVSQGVAASWAKRYKNAYPDDIWFHFFGKDIFDEMVALPFFNSVHVEPATNELDLTPELLLVVPDDSSVSSGRMHTSDGVVYDASNACPPCAAE